MDAGSPPIATGMPPLTGTTLIGPLTRRIRIMRIRRRCITPTRGFMDSMRRTDTTEVTTRIMGIIEVTIPIRTFIDGITVTVAVGMFHSPDAPTPTEATGVVKIGVHGIHGV